MAFKSSQLSTSPVMQIRLYVGDISTSTANELLADTDYSHFSSVTSSVWIAAQLAANSLAAKFTSVASDIKSKKVGDLTITYSDASDAATGYTKLAAKFGRMAAAQISPYAGGISRSDKSDVQADTDRVVPSFARGLMDNPAVIAFTGRSTST